jgi:hypothetical protein
MTSGTPPNPSSPADSVATSNAGHSARLLLPGIESGRRGKNHLLMAPESTKRRSHTYESQDTHVNPNIAAFG